MEDLFFCFTFSRIVVVQMAVVSVDVKILFFIFIDACRFWKDYQCFRFFFLVVVMVKLEVLMKH